MKILILSFLVALFFIVSVTALPVNYTITADNQSATEKISQTQNCDLECTFSLPPTTIENISSFSISDYDTKAVKDIKFVSTGSTTTQDKSDKVYILLEKRSVKIISVAPNLLYQGSNNLLIQVKNDGSEELLDVYGTVSGEGIKTKEYSSLDSFKPGQSDFLNVLLDVSAQDKADIIVKVFSASENLAQEINTVSIKSEQKPQVENKQQPVNITDATMKISKARDDLRKYEQEMYNKKADGYDVNNVASDIDQTKNQLEKIQLEYVRYSQQDFDLNYNVVLSNIEDIKSNLDISKPSKTIGDRIKDNIIIISTAIGLIISAFTAWGLAKTHVNVDSIKKLKKKK